MSPLWCLAPLNRRASVHGYDPQQALMSDTIFGTKTIRIWLYFEKPLLPSMRHGCLHKRR